MPSISIPILLKNSNNLVHKRLNCVYVCLCELKSKSFAKFNECCDQVMQNHMMNIQMTRTVLYLVCTMTGQVMKAFPYRIPFLEISK